VSSSDVAAGVSGYALLDGDDLRSASSFQDQAAHLARMRDRRDVAGRNFGRGGIMRHLNGAEAAAAELMQAFDYRRSAEYV
jgi:hypothetical protein